MPDQEELNTKEKQLHENLSGLEDEEKQNALEMGKGILNGKYFGGIFCNFSN